MCGLLLPDARKALSFSRGSADLAAAASLIIRWRLLVGHCQKTILAASLRAVVMVGRDLGDVSADPCDCVKLPRRMRQARARRRVCGVWSWGVAVARGIAAGWSDCTLVRGRPGGGSTWQYSIRAGGIVSGIHLICCWCCVW